MKKFVKIFAGVLGVLVLAAIIIPLVVDVDKYRPQILKAANEKINGKLELGKLSLSLWGRVQVRIDSLALSDTKRNSVVSVKDASFDIPFLSILSGSPLVTVHMIKPIVNITKNREGKLNVMDLMKPDATATASEKANATRPRAGEGESKKVELPGIVLNARVGILLEQAKVTYKDEAMALTNTIDQMNLRVKDFSLTRKTELELWADIKTTMGTELSVEGPIKLTAQLSPDVSGGEFKSAEMDATFSADDLAIEKGKVFHKKKGVPANFKFKGTLGQTNLKLDQAAVNFHNAEIVVSGEYHKDSGANFKFEAKPIDLESWSELIPAMKEYDLDGKLALTGQAKGKLEALQYNAHVSMKNFSMKGPNLKAKPIINADLEIVTDRIEKIVVDLKGPGNEITLNGRLVSFSKPQLTFDLRSPKGLDLDQWIEFPKTESGTAAKSTKGGDSNSSAKGAPGKEENLDASLDSLRTNAMMKEMGIDGNIAIAFIKAKGIRVDDLNANLQMHNLVAGISKFSMKIYGGSISGGFSTDLKPKQPQYSMNLAVNGIDLQKATESQFESLKNTVTGKLAASLNGGGASFNSEPAKRHLQMKGDFKITGAEFKTMDIAKMANDAINGSIGKIASKVPVLQGKKVNASANQGSKYDFISSNFTINNGTLDAPNFVAKASPKQGIDIKGVTKMGLIDQSLDAKWELTDSQRITGAEKLSVDVAGKTILNPLAKGENDPVMFPISVGCKWSAPCANYSQVVEHLAGVAASRLSHVAQDVVKNKVQEELKKGLGDGLKKLFGR